MPNRSDKQQLRRYLQQEATDGQRLTLAAARRVAEEMELPLWRVERFALKQGVVPQRYERNLGTLGVEGQLRLLKSSACVVGLGGLGGHVLESAARLGIGRILGVDADSFAESNLNRQLLATTENLRTPKVEAAARRVARVNPAVRFSGRAATFQQLEEDELRTCSVVFDCLDSVEARLELAEKCADVDRTLIHGAIAGWSGQVAVCRPGSRTLRRLYGEGKRGIEQRLGNLTFTAGTAANLMVARAVSLLLGRTSETPEEVLFFDLLDGEWRTVAL